MVVAEVGRQTYEVVKITCVFALSKHSAKASFCVLGLSTKLLFEHVSTVSRPVVCYVSLVSVTVFCCNSLQFTVMSSAALMQSSMQSLLLRFSSVTELPADYEFGAAVAVDLSLIEQLPQFAEFVGGCLDPA